MVPPPLFVMLRGVRLKGHAVAPQEREGQGGHAGSLEGPAIKRETTMPHPDKIAAAVLMARFLEGVAIMAAIDTMRPCWRTLM
jgi:hypothetical protein